MSKAKIAYLFTTCVLSSLSTNANQNIYVTGKRAQDFSENLSSAVDVFDRYDIEESGAMTLKSFLSQVTELNLFSNGTGQVTSVQMRGNDNRHTLLIVDGIPLSDVTSPDGASRFESLGLFDIEKIEILYGAQSVLYGNQAIGGVIKITTQKITREGRFQITGGDYGRRSLNTVYRSSYKDFQYKIFLGAEKMEGPSSRSPSLSNVSDDDQTTRLDANLMVSYKGFTFNQRYQKLDYEYDATAADELDDEGIYKNLNQSLQYKNDWLNAFVSRSSFERELKSVNDGISSKFTYKGASLRSRIATQYKERKYTLTAGLEGRSDTASELDNVLSEKKKRSLGELFIHGTLNTWQNFKLETGSRLTKNEGDSSVLTYKLGSIYKLNNESRMKVSFATGVKVPELYHLYTQFGANRDLRAERSKSIDLTYELEKSEVYTTRFSIFSSRYRNYIDYDLGESRYENIGKAKIYGFSHALDVNLISELSLSTSYTFLETENELDGNNLRLRPKHTYQLRLDYQLNDSIDIYLTHLYKGKRDDTNTTLSSYRLLNTGLRWQKSNNILINFALNNIFDEDYEEVAGFMTRGLNFLFQVEIRL